MFHTRPSKAALLSAAAVSVAAALAPAAASAASFEQVSRSSGAYTTAGTIPDQQATGLGDIGRFVSFGRYVRDVQANLTTQPGGSATVRTYGIDRLETKVLIGRQFSNRIELAVTPLTGGGLSKVLYTVPNVNVIDNALASVNLSVDGTTAEFCDYSTGQTKSVNTATGAITLLNAGAGQYNCAFALDRNLVSWDRRTRLTSPLGPLGGGTWQVVRDGNVVETLDEPRFPTVSGDGNTVVYGIRTPGRIGTSTIVVRRLSTGATTTLTLPAGHDDLNGLWLSERGDRLIPLELSGGIEGQLNTTTGAWSLINSPYATPVSYARGAVSQVLSPSGRFGLLAPARELALVDFTGADIPGASDPLSGDIYVEGTSAYLCGKLFGFPWPANNYGTLYATMLAKPVPWAPALRSANVTFRVDSTTIKTVNGLTPGARAEASFTGDRRNRTLTVTSTDELGNTATGAVTNYLGPCQP